jgi:nondiscriminating glutamyl-tRNA synthetase
MTVRVRYAPSPTGRLHIGGVRTALFNYLYARHFGGQLILRFEDTDLERNVPGAEDEMIQGFHWLGIEWVEGPDVGGPHAPYRCTERLPIYRDYLGQLSASGFAYPCFCTPEQLEADRQEAMNGGAAPRYSGRCRHLSSEERRRRIDAGEAYSWRFAVPAGQTLEFDDLVRGTVSFLSDDIGDFVIVKQNGIPTYNFQVVIDDALMQISYVIRGEEHLSNTPRQMMIFSALNLSLPQFAHLPQVLNQDRKKLSKRDPNVLPVEAYREKGYSPEAIVNFLALLGWSPGGEEEILSLAEVAERFDFDRVNKSGAIFDVDKLKWMSGQYMRRMDLDVLTQQVQAALAAVGAVMPAGCGPEWLRQLVGLYQEQLVCVADFWPLAQGFFAPTVGYSEEARGIIVQPGSPEVIERYLQLVDEESAWNAESSRARFRQIQKELNVKGRALYMPVRAAVTGEIHGPDLQQTVALLPQDWVKARLQNALQLV